MKTLRIAIVLMFVALASRAEFPLGVKRAGVAPDVTSEERLVAACGNRDCLVVWEQGGAPFFMRTNLLGEPLLERAVALEAARGKRALSVATDGASYIVTVAVDSGGYKLALFRIDPDGSIATVGEGLSRTSFAWTSYTLVWSGGQYTGVASMINGGIYAFVLDANGNVLRNEFRLATSSHTNLQQVLATAAGDRLAIFWYDAGRTNGRVIDPRLLLDPAFQPWTSAVLPGVPPTFDFPVSDVRSTGAELLLLARTKDVSRAQFLDLTGAPLGGVFDLQANYQLAAAGASRYFLLAFAFDQFTGSITSARLLPGATHEEVSTGVFGNGERPFVYGGAATAGNSLGALTVWLEAPEAGKTSRQVRAELVDAATGQPRHAGGHGVLVSTGYARQSEPVAVQRRDGQLFAWVESSDTSRVVLARYDASGRPLEPEPLVVQPAGAFQRAPALATDGSGALLAWYERDVTSVLKYDILHAAYVDPQSNHIRPLVLGTVWPGMRRPAVVCSSSVCVVAWAGTDGRIRMSRFTPDGLLLDSTPLVFTSQYSDPTQRGHLDTSPSLVWTGRDFYLVYEYLVDVDVPAPLGLPYAPLGELHGVRLSENLIAIGPEQLLSPAQSRFSEAAFSGAAMAGDSVLAAWRQSDESAGNLRLMWRTVSPSNELSPLQTGDWTATFAMPLVVAPFGNEARVAGATQLLAIGANGTLLSKKTVDAPILGMTTALPADGGFLTLIEQKRKDDALRLFAVPLMPPRARGVAHP